MSDDDDEDTGAAKVAAAMDGVMRRMQDVIDKKQRRKQRSDVVIRIRMASSVLAILDRIAASEAITRSAVVRRLLMRRWMKVRGNENDH